MLLRVTFVLLVVVAGCAGAKPETGPGLSQAPAGASAARASCAPVDSGLAHLGAVYRECEVDTPVRIRGRQPHPSFDPTPGSTKSCYSASVAFVVDEQGVPLAQTIQIVRSNDARFGAAVVESVASWRYTPAMKGGAPVKQLVELEQGAMIVRQVRGAPMPRGPTRPNC